MEPAQLLNQAVLAQDQGDLASAAAIYERILGKDKGSIEAAIGLGLCLHGLGRESAALPYLAKIANLSSTDSRVFEALGDCYNRAGLPGPASLAFERAVRLAPSSVNALLGLARSRSKQGQGIEANELVDRAIELEPDNARAHDLKGFLLPELGRFEEAKLAVKKACKLNPESAIFLSRYIHAGKVVEDDRWVVNNLGKVATRGLPRDELILAEYALGKANEDLSKYELSTRHFVKANKLAATRMGERGTTFDPLAHKREIEFLMKSPPEIKGLGNESELPIFIVGMMRSGTTLMEQIVSSHPLVTGAGELDFWIRNGPQVVKSSPEDISQVTAQYLKFLSSLGPGEARVCDKMPQNYMQLGLLHAALPNARIIHCRRDPRDTCLSIYTAPFTYDPPFAYSMKNIGAAYVQYQRVMAYWREVIPADRLMEVDYEDVVLNQEAVSRRVIAFLGLEWDERCLTPEKNDRFVNTPSRWQVRQPMYGSSVGRWERFMPWIGELVPDWSFVRDL